ncbi:hypothetical protein EV643_119170 [Kribbella sp. VKM Ac-2527]|uniref:Uncharacterized protein n=1 Tax=Kribbella caucasensis TaxID=2512215 RepID=A0A4R6K316_9ACTN|nr:hypothetical protein EV643_119170 [Kribbella sp. VKM Ac-2527]
MPTLVGSISLLVGCLPSSSWSTTKETSAARTGGIWAGSAMSQATQVVRRPSGNSVPLDS